VTWRAISVSPCIEVHNSALSFGGAGHKAEVPSLSNNITPKAEGLSRTRTRPTLNILLLLLIIILLLLLLPHLNLLLLLLLLRTALDRR